MNSETSTSVLFICLTLVFFGIKSCVIEADNKESQFALEKMRIERNCPQNPEPKAAKEKK